MVEFWSPWLAPRNRPHRPLQFLTDRRPFAQHQAKPFEKRRNSLAQLGPESTRWFFWTLSEFMDQNRKTKKRSFQADLGRLPFARSPQIRSLIFPVASLETIGFLAVPKRMQGHPQKGPKSFRRGSWVQGFNPSPGTVLLPSEGAESNKAKRNVKQSTNQAKKKRLGNARIAPFQSRKTQKESFKPPPPPTPPTPHPPLTPPTPPPPHPTPRPPHFTPSASPWRGAGPPPAAPAAPSPRRSSAPAAPPRAPARRPPGEWGPAGARDLERAQGFPKKGNQMDGWLKGFLSLGRGFLVG